MEPQVVAPAVVQGQLLGLQFATPLDLEAAIHDVHEGVVAGIDRQVQSAALGDVDVVVEGRTVGLRVRRLAEGLAHQHLDAVVFRLDDGKVGPVAKGGDGRAEFLSRRQVQPNLEPVNDAPIAANLHAAHLFVDGAPARAEHHELALAVDQVVLEAVRVAATAGQQIGSGRDPGMGVGLDVHAQRPRVDLKRTEFVQHHKGGHEVSVVASEASEDGHVLHHGPLAVQHLGHAPLGGGREESGRRGHPGGGHSSGPDDGGALDELPAQHDLKIRSPKKQNPPWWAGLLRRDGDSNPGYPFGVYTLSKRAP